MKEVDAQRKAAGMLEKTSREQAMPAVVDASYDALTSRRGGAAEAVGRTGDVRTVGALVDALKDNDACIREKAAQTLGRIGGDRSVAALVDALKDSDRKVRDSATEALTRIGGDLTVAALVAALKDRESYVRIGAVEVLGRIGDEAAVDALVDALKDSDFVVRENAVKVLRRIGGGQRAHEVLLVALKDNDASVRESAAESLRLMGGGGPAASAFVDFLQYIAREKVLEETRAFIAHEVKNAIGPLRVIAQLLNETLSEPDFDRDKLAEYTARILKQTDAVYEVVNRYVDYAQPLVPQFNPTDVNQLLTKCTNEISAECERKNVAIDLQLGQTSRAFVDAVLIEQVFRNVLQNAMEATDCRGKLTVATRQEANRIQVIFSDTGAGIKPENLGRVFDLGFTTKMGKRGAGLGLALVHRIVEEAHSGSVNITNNPDGKGATLTIELPSSD